MSRRKPRSRPAGAPEPQDFKTPSDPTSPAEREVAAEETVSVQFRGFDFEVPKDPGKWSWWRVTQWLPSNNFPNACIGLLGAQQTTQIHMRHPSMTTAEAGEFFAELFMAIAKATGFGSAGNS